MRLSYVLKDIAGYEERIIFGLTMRQAFWGGVALSLGVSFFLITNNLLHLPQDLCIYGTMVISFGFFVLGWAKWQDTRPFSDYIKAFIRFNRMKQKVIYSNNVSYFKEGTHVKKTRKDKKINKSCVEWRK